MKTTILTDPWIAEEKDIVNKKTGEIYSGALNELIIFEHKRENGTIRVSQDYRFCPTLAEQHTAHLTNINYLIERYKPDELAAYISAKNQHRQEILGHDFSAEPELMHARNITYTLQQSFHQLPDEIKNQFKNHVEFLKFIDNPLNQEKMLKMGILTPKQIQQNTTNQKLETNDESNDDKTPVSTPSEKAPSKTHSSKQADE